MGAAAMMMMLAAMRVTRSTGIFRGGKILTLGHPMAGRRVPRTGILHRVNCPSGCTSTCPGEEAEHKDPCEK